MEEKKLKLFDQRGMLRKEIPGVRVRVTDKGTGSLIGMRVFVRPVRCGLKGFVRAITECDSRFLIQVEETDSNPPFVHIHI